MSRIIYEQDYPKEAFEEQANEPGKTEKRPISFEDFMRRGFENRCSIPIPDRKNNAKAFIAAARDVSELYKIDLKITEYIDHLAADFSFNASACIRRRPAAAGAEQNGRGAV